MDEIVKPINRSPLRQVLGKEYYIAKRKILWLFGPSIWAKQAKHDMEGSLVFKHRSLILRHLKDVDMYLQENKRKNLELAIAKVNNTVIKPNETFSVWKLVGRPTARKGYLDGLVLKQGKAVKGVGGGLCQLGNLLFWIFAHSPLTITERYRHGFDVFPDINRKVPFGAGATLSYNHIDLQVKNETPHIFQIRLWLDDQYLNGELICESPIEENFEVVERNHIIKQQSWGGYSRHNQVFQIVNKGDGSIEERLLVQNHAVMMYNPFLNQ